MNPLSPSQLNITTQTEQILSGLSLAHPLPANILIRSLNIQARAFLQSNQPIQAAQACREVLKHVPLNLFALNTYISASLTMFQLERHRVLYEYSCGEF